MILCSTLYLQRIFKLIKKQILGILVRFLDYFNQYCKILEHNLSLIEMKWSRKASFFWRSMPKSNVWIRTTDLGVMSLVCCHCATLFLIIKLKKLKVIKIRKSQKMMLFVPYTFDQRKTML